MQKVNLLSCLQIVTLLVIEKKKDKKKERGEKEREKDEENRKETEQTKSLRKK